MGITSTKRAATAPALPTESEAGPPGFKFATWYGVLAPGDTPASLIALLQQTVTRAMATPDLRDKFEDGLLPLSSTSAEFATHLKRDINTWASVVTALGLGASP